MIPLTNAVTKAELKNVLKDSLLSFFKNPSKSRLTRNELKDLLISFFETPRGQEVNLNKNGRFSGKLLQEIYNKARMKKWTIMVFMNGDNNLEGFGIQNINDMEKVGSSKDVNVIVQFDRSPEFDASNGNWNTTKIFYVTRDNNSEIINSKELADLGEIDMGKSKSLEYFAFFSMENYPAEHYALVLWNHGGGWRGLSNDDTDNPNGMSVEELTNALRNITARKNMKFDIVGFDMCLMSMLEVYSQISEFAGIGIGSEELEPGEGWNYEGMLKFIAENPDSDARTFASQITRAYHNLYEGSDETITLSAVNLSRMSNIIRSTSGIVSKINSSMERIWPKITRTNDIVEKFNSDFGAFSYIDIFDFLDLLASKSANADIINDLADAKKSLSDAVISNDVGAGHRFASGLSIYFPASSDKYNENYEMKANKFLDKTGWGGMVKRYYNAKELDKEPPFIKINNFTKQEGSIDFKIGLKGSDILDLIFVVSNSQNNISVDLFEAPLGFDFSEFEEGQVEVSWDYRIPFIFNGANYTFSILKTTDRDGTKFLTQGLYSSYAQNKTFNSTLYFEDGRLSGVYSFEQSGGEFIASPLEIMENDTFTPVLRAFDAQTSEFFDYQGIPIKIGNGLDIEYARINLTESIATVFAAQDLSGNINIDEAVPGK